MWRTAMDVQAEPVDVELDTPGEIVDLDVHVDLGHGSM